MNAEKWLLEVQRLDEKVNAQIKKCDRLIAMATDTSAKMPDGMPFNHTGVVPQKMQSAVIDLTLAKQELDRLIDQFVDYKANVIKVLEQLDGNERIVLYKHYIEYMPWVDVANDMNYSRMQIWRIEKKALKNLEKFLQNS